jgi:carbamoyltransferase
MTYILGISYNYHDSSAALLRAGEIIAACEEERFSRIKHDSSFPVLSIRYVLGYAAITISDVSAIVVYEDPLIKLRRQSRFAILGLMRGKVHNFLRLIKGLSRFDLTSSDVANRFLAFGLAGPGQSKSLSNKVFFSQHHLSHAASAYYPSPFSHSAILCIDGVGESETTSAWIAKGNKLERLFSIAYPHSLGLLYSAFTYYCGFKVNSGEYKLMGLAPYGSPIYVETIESKLIDYKQRHGFILNMHYFSFCYDKQMLNSRFISLFGRPPRNPESEIDQFYKDIAASIQCVCERVVEKLAKEIHHITQADNLCMAGGVALNCVSNGKLASKGLFKNIWIQPAGGDAGSSLGAAYAYHYQYQGNSRISSSSRDKMKGCYLGPSYSDEDILACLAHQNIPYARFTDEELFYKVASLLAKGNVIGWFNGRMEFGPRALGSRSILGDARLADMQRNINLKIKFRESFRPFAPAVLSDRASNIFQDCHDSPYMLFTYKCVSNSNIDLSHENTVYPSIIHVDGSARVQTVSEAESPSFWSLIKSFEKITGCPLIINTSFNLRGEPIVCSPQDAYECFMRTFMDVLVLENYVVMKSEIPSHIADSYKKGAVYLD